MRMGTLPTPGDSPGRTETGIVRPTKIPYLQNLPLLEMKYTSTIRLVLVLQCLAIIGILTSACGERADDGTSGNALPGTAWRLTESPGMKIPESIQVPTLLFASDRYTVAGTAGINRYIGEYEVEASRLHFNELGTTRMAGEPEGMAFESHYLDTLRSVEAWRFEGNRLELLREGVVVATFVPAEAHQR